MIDKFVEDFNTVLGGWSVLLLILGFSLLLTGLVVLLWYLDNKKHKNFRETASVGTEVFAQTSQTGFDGIVTKVDDEYVTIETKVRKHRIYPKKKK